MCLVRCGGRHRDIIQIVWFMETKITGDKRFRNKEGELGISFSVTEQENLCDSKAGSWSMEYTEMHSVVIAKYY